MLEGAGGLLFPFWQWPAHGTVPVLGLFTGMAIVFSPPSPRMLLSHGERLGSSCFHFLYGLYNFLEEVQKTLKLPSLT